MPARQPAMAPATASERPPCGSTRSGSSRSARTEGGPTSVLQAIVLGITQGLTEFAPVSSSGHLILVPWLFGWTIVNDPALNKTFDVALHMGTLLGALIYFRSDVALYLGAWIRSIRKRSVETADERIAWLLILGTIPGAIAGALFESVIEDKLGQPWLIAVFLVVGGVVLYFVDTRVRSDRVLADLRTKDAAIIGVAQAVALQPGVSRSGITITAARALGVDRPSAARFSFLLSLPIIAGAGLFKAVDLVGTGFQGYGSQFFWGFVASAISGYLVIAFLLSYLRRHDLTVFVIYRLGVAALVFVVIATGFRSATI